MRWTFAFALTGGLAVLAAGAIAQNRAAPQGLGLRPGPIDQTLAAPDVNRQDTAGRFERSYRQQPPMVPHRIEGYEVDLKVNKCMSCHDWPQNVTEKAPKISETHYMNREGVKLDAVSPGRWFCTQCHAPQVNAKPLVGNTFKGAGETK